MPQEVSFNEISPLATSPEIASAFPFSSSFSPVIGIRGKGTPVPSRVGVLFSGGPAPGGHNVVASLLDTLKKSFPSSSLLGFLGGPDAILSGVFRELKQEDLEPFRNQGGFDLLGSGRTKIKTSDQFHAVLKTATHLKLDGLVIIGGDDSNTNAANLAEYFLKENCSTCIIGVPKTIDGDIQNPFVPISFGFDTAAKIYSEMIGNLCRDTVSSLKYFHVVKIMGRSASHLTLECALKTHPNIALIAEEKKPFSLIVSELADCIEKRHAQKTPYGVILVPEGLLEHVPDLPSLDGERDMFGNLSLSMIETEKILIAAVKKELEKRRFTEKFQPVPHFYGYEGRCGHPSNFDANYSYALGACAALLIGHRKTAMMAYVGKLDKAPSEWNFGGAPFPPFLKMREAGAFLEKALVNLSGRAFHRFAAKRSQWALHSSYQNPGPIQFEGALEVTDSCPEILRS